MGDLIDLFEEEEQPASRVEVADADPNLPSEVCFYVAGACFPNPGAMGVGIVRFDGPSDKTRREVGTHVGPGTNNLAEIKAVQVALRVAPRDRPVVFFTHSKYLIDALSTDRKLSVNMEAAVEARKALREFPRAIFVKVHAGTGDVLNDRARELASLGAQRIAARPAPLAAP